MFKMNLECLGLVNTLKFVLIKIIRNNSLTVYMAEQILLIQCIWNIKPFNKYRMGSILLFLVESGHRGLARVYTALWTSHI